MRCDTTTHRQLLINSASPMGISALACQHRYLTKLATSTSFGGEVGRRHLLLVAISVVLVLHALVVSRFLPSSFFFIVAFCWLWVGVSALFDRLQAARSMAATVTLALLVGALLQETSGLGHGDARAFYFLAMLPALTASLCVYVFVRHLQTAEDVSGRALQDWFEEQDAERPDLTATPDQAGEQFAAQVMNDVSHDNVRPPRLTTRGLPPGLKAAS